MEKELTAKKILERLEVHGFQAYFVGGFVRDKLLSREVNDIDIATDADPAQVSRLFAKTIPTGIKHGTVTVILSEIPYEVTTFRSEGKYLDHRRPSEVTYVETIEEDLSRRDFTINAIAMDLAGKIIDPYTGQVALQERIIAAVGSPDERFSEDPLRMLRAIRFAAQLDFFIAEPTWRSIIDNGEQLQNVAIERVKLELDKIMLSKNPERGIQLLFESKLISFIKGLSSTGLPALDYQEIIMNIRRTDDVILRWFSLLAQLEAAERSKVLKLLRFTKVEVEQFKKLTRVLDILQEGSSTVILKKALLAANLDFCLKAITFQLINGGISQGEYQELATNLHTLDRSLPVRSITDLAIDGRELIEYFAVSGGPWVKEVLEELLKRVIFFDLPNEQKELLKYAKFIKKEVEK